MNKKVILTLAFLLPVIPVVEWIISGVRDFSNLGDVQLPLSLIVIYYPARVLALVGFVMMFYQFLLSARLPVLQAVFKQPNLIRTHRSLGKVGFILMLLHGLMMLLTDLVDYGAVVFTVGKLLGIVALFLLIMAVVAAWWLRPLQFSLKVWKGFHVLAFFVFPLAFVHAITIGTVAGVWSPTRIVFIIFFGVYLYVAGRKIVSLARGESAPGAGKKPAAKTSTKPAANNEAKHAASPAAGPAESDPSS